MSTPRRRTKQQIMDELLAAIKQEKVEHDARISRVGIFLFPHAPDLPLAPQKDTDPHVVLREIDRLLHAKKPIEVLDKLIEIATAKRDELAQKASRKTPPNPSLKSVAEVR